MVTMKVSKLFSVSIALALLPPPVLGQGGGLGTDGGSGGGGMTSGQPTISSSKSTSTSMTPVSHTTRGAISSTTASTSMAGPPLNGTSEDDEMPPPINNTTTATSTSARSMEPPPNDASEDSSLPPPDATATNSSMDSSMGSLPPPESSGSGGGSSRPQDGGPGGDSTDEIYFPSMYTAECDHHGEDAHYAVKFSGSGDIMIRQVSSETGCANTVNWGVDKGPDYHFPGRVTPSNASIPAYPMMIGGSGTTDLSETNGQVAVLVNGVAMFSAWATEPAVDYESTAFYLERDTLDACGGHATTEGWYHYHGTPGCLEEQVMKGEGLTLSDHSPFLGWSYDGFPMYGHLGPNGIEMRACDTNGADDTYCLDSCSGYEGELPEIDGFTYRYYLTCGYDDSFFPMTVNCFRGCCPDGIECNTIVEACDDTAELGYSSTHEPELGYIYTDMYDVEALSGYDVEYINSSTLVNCTMFYDEALEYTVEQINAEDFPTSPVSSGPTPSPALSIETRAPQSFTASPSPLSFNDASPTPSPPDQSLRTPSSFLKESMWTPTRSPDHGAAEDEDLMPSSAGSFMRLMPSSTGSFVGPAYRRSMPPTSRKSKKIHGGGSTTATLSPVPGADVGDGRGGGREKSERGNKPSDAIGDSSGSRRVLSSRAGTTVAAAGGL